jgi:hypothetical protein
MNASWGERLGGKRVRRIRTNPDKTCNDIFEILAEF